MSIIRHLWTRHPIPTDCYWVGTCRRKVGTTALLPGVYGKSSGWSGGPSAGAIHCAWLFSCVGFRCRERVAALRRRKAAHSKRWRATIDGAGPTIGRDSVWSAVHSTAFHFSCSTNRSGKGMGSRVRQFYYQKVKCARIPPRPPVGAHKLREQRILSRSGWIVPMGQLPMSLTSTNLTQPLRQWMRIATNVMGVEGNFTITVTNR